MKRLLLSAATVACVQASFGQTVPNTDTTRKPDMKELEEVEVTSSANRKILYQPAAITKLAPRELRRSTGLFLDDAINANVPGVQMMRRGVSSGQVINIRGYGAGVRGANGASSNFDIQGVKMYLNGIPLTDAEGITVLDDIDFATVGSAEIVKGPAGTLYGQAIAGAVNLRTMKAEPGKTSVGQQVLLGNYGLQRYTTTFQHGSERSSILLNYGHQESDGSSIHNHSRKDFVNFAGDFTPNARQAITAFLGFANSYDERFGELDTAQWRREDYSGNPNYIKNDAHSRIVSVRAGIGHTYVFSERFSNTTTVFGYSAATDASSAGGWTDKNPVNFGARSTFNTRFALGRATLSGLTGIESLHQRAQKVDYRMGADRRDPLAYNRVDSVRGNVATQTAANSVFTDWTLGLPGDLSFTVGVSWNQLRLKLNDRQLGLTIASSRNAVVPDVYSQTYEDMWSPRVAVNKVFAGKISTYASWSRGFKAPTTAYFYLPFANGAPATAKVNTGLVPERGDQFELGSKGALAQDRLTYEVAIFRTVFSNKMTTIAVPLNNDPATATTEYSYVTNGGKQIHKGIEIALRVAAYQSATGFFKEVAPFVNFTYTDGKYEDFRFMRFRLGQNNKKDSTVDFSGNKVAGLPPVVFNAGIDIVTRPGLYFNAYYAYRDAIYLTGDNLVRAESFGLINAKLGFRRSVGAHFDLDASVGAVNLGGTQYYQMVFINQLPDAYVPAPRDTQWFGSIALKYNF
ncbi:TonB-dependent receptor [Flaviaesturariibacter flavus]|uniref:TonB-dependent receptor n=1 Tax=Flaviaesturariibacter flavus TaxID=2502780 RepID=A0A4V2NWZ6_9BACT|nr:TonB-dependent receptor [Flaviaesturariibacter flavus]TCJ19252.1 TonB-dependent receptor [Flaviaesturariibacter flavus]